MTYKYINEYVGQFLCDKTIKEVYFPNQDKGNCIEVGAVMGGQNSNTLYFEKAGWNCLCIEPQPDFYKVLRQDRKLALNYAISSEEKDDATFYQVYCKPHGYTQHKIWDGVCGLKVDERLLKEHVDLGIDPQIKEIKVKTKRLDWCIDNYFNYDTIDFISIDTENTELDVLQSFDVTKYNIKLLVIENNFNDPDVENYLKTYGWKKDRREVINDFFIKV